VAEADYVGIYSGRSEDKFAATGLTAVKSELVNAPYVEECPLVLECEVIHTIEIGSHTQFIGRIVDAKADAEALNANGQPDMTKLAPFVFAPGSQRYYRVGEFVGQGFSVGRK
jgi:flavin reductase (DIM6/NTAB) family NADH-FMN oxidoreductase RutF